MAVITNTTRTAVGLPGGTVLEPSVPTPVHGWDKIKENHVVKAWLKAGVLRAEAAPTDDQGSQFVQPDKAGLQAKLDALEVQYDKRSGTAKLLALLAEAEESARAKAIEAAAIEASGKTADEFAALPEEERAALLQAAAGKLQA